MCRMLWSYAHLSPCLKQRQQHNNNNYYKNTQQQQHNNNTTTHNNNTQQPHTKTTHNNSNNTHTTTHTTTCTTTHTTTTHTTTTHTTTTHTTTQQQNTTTPQHHNTTTFNTQHNKTTPQHHNTTTTQHTQQTTHTPPVEEYTSPVPVVDAVPARVMDFIAPSCPYTVFLSHQRLQTQRHTSRVSLAPRVERAPRLRQVLCRDAVLWTRPGTCLTCRWNGSCVLPWRAWGTSGDARKSERETVGGDFAAPQS